MTLLRRHKSPLYCLLRRTLVIGVIGILGLKFAGVDVFNQQSQQVSQVTYTSRHLLSTVQWEQCDFEIGHKRNYSEPSSWTHPSIANGWVALYVFLTLIVFVALAIICDDFFVPSLEAISDKLNLSEDVAGATFMAAGSSAPELFTSIAGVAVESDVGVGTIVGSAVFNLLGIVALSAAFAGQVLQLDWKPLTRDATYYALSLCFFILFAWDGKFELYESVIMLVMYFLYIVVMKFNSKLMALLMKIGKKKVSPQDAARRNTTANASEKQNSDTNNLEDAAEEGECEEDTEKTRKFSHTNRGFIIPDARKSHASVSGDKNILNLPGIKETTATNETKHVEEEEDVTPVSDIDEGDVPVVICPCLPPVEADIPTKHGPGCLNMLRLILSWILFLMSFPFVILFTWTIPNCSTPQTKKWYLISFFMSIFWIAALSFAMVTLVGRAGCILGVDKFTMGLVVVAIGTSIPDALSSILVARDGYGDMAVSNAIGSNIFDIDLGIGLPFVISSLIRDMKPIVLITAEQQAMFDSGELLIIPHVKFGFILLIILVASLIVFGISKFRLTKFLGIAFVLIYFMFVAYAYVQDLHCDNSC